MSKQHVGQLVKTPCGNLVGKVVQAPGDAIVLAVAGTHEAGTMHTDDLEPATQQEWDAFAAKVAEEAFPEE